MKIKEMSVDETNAKSMERRHSRTPSVHQQDLGFEWNEKHEELVKKWQERSTHYTKLHNMAGKHYSTLNSWLGIPTKVCLSLIASIEFSQLTNVESAGWSFYFNGVIALLTLALETVQDYLGFSPRSAKATILRFSLTAAPIFVLHTSILIILIFELIKGKEAIAVLKWS